MRQLKNFSNKKSKTVDDKEVIEDYMGKYKGYSQEQLIDQLMKSIRQSRENGTYSQEQMETFVQMVSPQLTQAQRDKLDNMIKLINEEISQE